MQHANTISKDPPSHGHGPYMAYRCAVCGLPAKGPQCGVIACDACAWFFRETVANGLTYECPQQGNCDTTRAYCSSCHFSTCQRVGMKPEALDPMGNQVSGRSVVPGRESENATFQPPHQSPDSSYLNVNKVENGFRAVGDSAKKPYDHIAEIVNSRPDIEPELLNAQDLLHSKTVADSRSEVVAQGWSEELRLIVQWSKRLPGFASLNVDDQLSLLKASIVDVACLRLAFRCLVGSSGCSDQQEVTSSTPQGQEVTIRWGRGLQLTLEESHSLWAVEGLEGGQRCFHAFAHLVASLRRLRLDLTQFAALCALLLFSPDCSGLCQRAAVERLQTAAVDALRAHTQARDSSDPHGLLLLKLSAVRRLSSCARLRLQELNISGYFGEDPLAAELLRDP